eukprot:2056715-Pleurochrysis_carterae.AAC.2
MTKHGQIRRNLEKASHEALSSHTDRGLGSFAAHQQVEQEDLRRDDVRPEQHCSNERRGSLHLVDPRLADERPEGHGEHRGDGPRLLLVGRHEEVGRAVDVGKRREPGLEGDHGDERDAEAAQKKEKELCKEPHVARQDLAERDDEHAEILLLFDALEHAQVEGHAAQAEQQQARVLERLAQGGGVRRVDHAQAQAAAQTEGRPVERDRQRKHQQRQPVEPVPKAVPVGVGDEGARPGLVELIDRQRNRPHGENKVENRARL